MQLDQALDQVHDCVLPPSPVVCQVRWQFLVAQLAACRAGAVQVDQRASTLGHLGPDGVQIGAKRQLLG